MAFLWVAGFGSFTLASLAIGARLLWLARRTRQIPEAALGTSLFLGGLGYVPLVLAFRVVTPDHAPWLLAIGNAVLHAGAIALAVGTWRVFRASERWPVAIAVALGVWLLLSFALRLAHFREMPPPGSVFWTSTLGGAAAYAWSTAESFRCWSMSRRRRRIGLVDAAITRRFALWGVCGACAVGMHVASMVGRIFAGEALPASAVVASSALGLVAAGSLAIAFAPGSKRRARERARASQAG